METKTHWITHGFDEDLNKAMRQPTDQMLAFLQSKRSMTAAEAYSFISVTVGFSVT
jgi:acetamidase/formamidase